MFFSSFLHASYFAGAVASLGVYARSGAACVHEIRRKSHKLYINISIYHSPLHGSNNRRKNKKYIPRKKRKNIKPAVDEQDLT